MNINSEIISKVESIAYGGDGIIKEKTLTGFVKRVMPGELIKVRAIEIKKNYFRAELIEIIEKSPYRVTPPCPYFNICAGCAYQHIAYEKHPEIKTKQLQELLEHIGKIKILNPINPAPSNSANGGTGSIISPSYSYSLPSSFLPNFSTFFVKGLGKLQDFQRRGGIKFISSPKPYSYRNQLDITTKIIRKKIEMGFIGFDNKTLVPIDKCLIAKEALNDGIKKVKEELNNPISIKNINPAPSNGVLNSAGRIISYHPHPQQHPCRQDSKLRDFRRRGGIKGDIILKCGHDDAIDFAFSEAVLPKGNYKLLSEIIDGQTYYFSLSTFFQTNPYILQPLLSELKNMLNPEPDETLFDLYCGTGLFSIYFSQSVKNAYGIELNPSSIKLAQKTAEKNNIKNCRFFEGDAEDLFTKIFTKYKTDKNIIILDPPRTGLNSEILKHLQEINPAPSNPANGRTGRVIPPQAESKRDVGRRGGIKTNKLVYISCEPSKLARDLNILCANGYEIKNIIIADMFPQTKHMETIAILSNS